MSKIKFSIFLVIFSYVFSFNIIAGELRDYSLPSERYIDKYQLNENNRHDRSSAADLYGNGLHNNKDFNFTNEMWKLIKTLDKERSSLTHSQICKLRTNYSERLEKAFRENDRRKINFFKKMLYLLEFELGKRGQK